MEFRVFEEHHQVLKAWAEYRRSRENAPAALTLDHHTDTLPAFGRTAADETERQKWIAETDFNLSHSVAGAIKKLRHDEHLDLALRSGMISRSIVIAHFDNPGCANEHIQVVSPVWQDLTVLLNDPQRFHPLAASVLEDGFLAPLLEKAHFVPEENPGFILDIDMDYALNSKVFSPAGSTIFHRLLHHAGLVTISREDIWMKLLRTEPDWDFERAFAALQKFCTGF